MNPLTPLREVLTNPGDVPAVLAWLAGQIRLVADSRDYAEAGMTRLGIGGEAIAAYHEATADLRDLAARYAYDCTVRRGGGQA